MRPFLTGNARLYILLVSLGCVFVVGGATTYWVGKVADREQREVLLGWTGTAATTLLPEQLSALAGSEIDLTNPQYLDLKRHLASLRNAVPNVRFYYVLRKVDDGVIFLCDSEPADSRDYSPPGQLYQEAAPEFAQALTQGSSAVVGPWTDRWGRWISAVVPIAGNDGKVVASLGADVDARFWARDIRGHRLGAASITILLIVVLTLAYTMQAQARKADEALWESAERFRISFELSPVCAATVSPDYRLIHANEATSKFLGYTQEEMKRLGISDITYPEDRSAGSEQIKAMLEGRLDCFEMEKRYVRKDGAIVWGQVSNRIVRNADGKPLYFLPVIIDITERKRAEEALRSSESKLRASINGCPIPQFVLGPDHRVTLWNKALEECSGLSAADVIGTTRQWQAFYGEARPCLADFLLDNKLREIESAYEGNCVASRFLEGAYEGVGFFPRLGVSGKWLSYTAALLHDAQGTVVGAIETLEDITHRKDAETERLRLENQLAQAQKMESVGLLAGGVAHDFNNILTVILGYGELCLDELSEESSLHPMIAEVMNAAHRARDLTRQLLAFSRKQVLDVRIVEMNAVVLGFEKLIRRIIGEDIELQIAVSPEAGRVSADVSQLEQVLLNLAVNSRDAMPDGGQLTLETGSVFLDEHYAATHPGTRPGSYVMVSVTDTGAGMDEETQSRIFEPFFTTKERGKGTGLGLATAFGIVKQHGGSIWVYSEPGEGTTFKIYLPEVSAEATEPSVPHKDYAGPAQGETILVIEDEKAVRELVCRMLRMTGYTVIEATSVSESLTIAGQAERIDLLLTDVIMPEMNGRQAYEHIAALRPGLKVLYMSGYTENGIVHRGILDSGVEFISKPFSEELLTRRIREVLDKA